SSPREGLQKTEEVFQMFKNLMSKSDKAVNWNCEDEYANNLPEATTALNIQTTGTTECQCSCPQAMKYFIFTKSAPTSSPASYTQSKAYISINTNEESRAPLDQNSAISPVPGPITGLYTKTELFLEERSGPAQEESTNFIMSTISDLMDNSRDSSVAMRSEPQPVTFTPTASSSELPSIQTRTLFQSATSQPTEKINTPLISERNPVQILAKRSLDTSEQGMLSDSYFKLLWRRITENTGIRKEVKLEEIISKETENLPLGNQNSPTHLQMQLHMPRNVFKITSKEADFKDPTFRKDTEDRSDQKSIKHVKRNSVENEYQLANISIYSTFLTTSTCTLLLILTLLFYYKHR
ncbi:macrophage colony-stimulating factor 1 precursor, partial [Silurus meridionalis]